MRHHLATVSIGRDVLVAWLDGSIVELTIFDGSEASTYTTPSPNGYDLSLALEWSLACAMNLGLVGEIILLHEGDIHRDEVSQIVADSTLTWQARYASSAQPAHQLN